MKGNNMLRILFISLTLLVFVFTGCGNGESPQSENETVTDSNAGSEVPTIEILPPALEVGQWIEYGISDSQETIMLAVVGSEDYTGTECLWLQFSGDEFVAQVLLDPTCLDGIAEYSSVEFSLFMDDPAEYVKTKIEENEDMSQILLQEDNKTMMIDLLRGIKLVKFESNGGVMGFDLAGVADFVEEQMNSPEMREEMRQEMEKQSKTDIDSLLAELDDLEFEINQSDISIAGQMIPGWVIELDSPDAVFSVSLSSELPILPLASLHVESPEESISVNVLDYGFDGVRNLMPETPEQYIPVMMFLQGMMQQFEQSSDPVIK